MKVHSWLPLLLPALLGSAACGGDDDDGGNAPPPGAAKPPAAPAASAGNGHLLSPMPKVEDRVTDPAEKASIRHQFRDTDFAPDQTIGQVANRDPFVSFVLLQPGMFSGTEAPKVHIEGPGCTRADQFVATNYTYADLRLVGIVTQGTQRKVLMMDPGNLGHIIRRNDCVGREKAVVKDIGTGYVTFVINPSDGAPQAEEHSVPLYPNQTPVSSQPDLPEGVTPTGNGTTGAPVIAPPSSSAPKGNAPAVELPTRKK